jgi:putative addiction module component (TIGR02574 family)
MANIDLDEILHLPLEARLALVERIWDSIAAESGALALPEDHRAELERRLDAPAPGPDLSWDEVRTSLRSPDA